MEDKKRITCRGAPFKHGKYEWDGFYGRQFILLTLWRNLAALKKNTQAEKALQAASKEQH